MKKSIYILFRTLILALLIPASVFGISVGWERLVVGSIHPFYADKVLIGGTSTTTDATLEVIGNTYISGTLGIASTSPNALLSIGNKASIDSSGNIIGIWTGSVIGSSYITEADPLWIASSTEYLTIGSANLTYLATGTATLTYVARNDWTTIDNYPTACTNQAVTGIGDTLTCTTIDISAMTNLATSTGILLTGDILSVEQSEINLANLAGTLLIASTTGTIDISDRTNLATSGSLISLIGDAVGVNEGTLTNGKGCIFTSGTGIVCNSTFLTAYSETDPLWTASSTEYLRIGNETALTTSTAGLTVSGHSIGLVLADIDLANLAGTLSISSTTGGVVVDRISYANATTDEQCLTYEETGNGFEWQACGTGSATYDPTWILNGTSLYASDTISYVGIGTNAPTSLLELQGGELVIGGIASSTITGGGSNSTFNSGFDIYGDVNMHDSSAFTFYNSGDNNYNYFYTGSEGELFLNDSVSNILSVSTTTFNFNDTFVVDPLGNVGIGTTSPDALLTVSPGTSYADNPTIKITSSYADGYRATLSLKNTHTGGREYAIVSANNADGWFGGGKFGIVDITANTPRMTIDTTGLVGIGETSPGAKLSVSGGMAVGSSYDTTAVTDGNLIISGNVGIGTTSPQAKLDVWDGNFALSDTDVAHGMTLVASTNVYAHMQPLSGTLGGVIFRGISDGDATGMVLEGIIGSTDPTDTKPALILRGSKKNTTEQQVLGDAETLLQIDSWGTAKVTVLGSGNVGIGTTSPAYTLDIEGNLNVEASSTFPTYTSCNLETNVNGLMICGTDDTGTGGDTSSWVLSNGLGYASTTVAQWLIGGTSTTTADSILEVIGTSTFGAFTIDNLGNASTSGNFIITGNLNLTGSFDYATITDATMTACSLAADIVNSSGTSPIGWDYVVGYLNSTSTKLESAIIPASYWVSPSTTAMHASDTFSLIGINTLTPSYALDVWGSVAFGTTTAGSGFLFNSDTGNITLTNASTTGLTISGVLDYASATAWDTIYKYAASGGMDFTITVPTTTAGDNFYPFRTMGYDATITTVIGYTASAGGVTFSIYEGDASNTATATIATVLADEYGQSTTSDDQVHANDVLSIQITSASNTEPYVKVRINFDYDK